MIKLSNIKCLRRRGAPWGVLGAVILMAGCAAPVPVQEMSNARQALQAAHAVQADRLAPGPMREAQDLLQEARSYLQRGAYGEARQRAMAARLAAYRARQQALYEKRGAR